MTCLCSSGERDSVEIITAGIARLSRDSDRMSTGSTQSAGTCNHSSPQCLFLINPSFHPTQLCNYTSSDKDSSLASRSGLQSALPGSNPFEGEKTEEEEEGFVDPELPYQVAEDGKEGDSFNMFPSRADEALKTCKYNEYISAACTNNSATKSKHYTASHLSRSGSIEAGVGDPADVPAGL